jgi:nonsense-mediated mRNA decay protein 3
VQVEIARKEDFGTNDKTFIVNSHLGEILNYNDTVLGYDLDAMNLADLEDYQHGSKTMPDVVLVKKTYPRLRKAQKNRIWKLKHLDKEAVDENNIHKKKAQGNKNDRDYEMFLRDIEDDPEMRQQIALFRNEDVIGELEKKIAALDLDDTVKKSPLQE